MPPPLGDHTSVQKNDVEYLVRTPKRGKKYVLRNYRSIFSCCGFSLESVCYVSMSCGSGLDKQTDVSIEHIAISSIYISKCHKTEKWFLFTTRAHLNGRHWIQITTKITTSPYRTSPCLVTYDTRYVSVRRTNRKRKQRKMNLRWHDVCEGEPTIIPCYLRTYVVYVKALSVLECMWEKMRPRIDNKSHRINANSKYWLCTIKGESANTT